MSTEPTRTDRSADWAPSDFGWANFDTPDANGYERSDAQKDYEVLRDTIIAAFNPPDEDIAEPALMTQTLDAAWSFIVAQPCRCEPTNDIYEIEPCHRCLVLGRSADTELER